MDSFFDPDLLYAFLARTSRVTVEQFFGLLVDGAATEREFVFCAGRMNDVSSPVRLCERVEKFARRFRCSSFRWQR